MKMIDFIQGFDLLVRAFPATLLGFTGMMVLDVAPG
jgi:hypothetical protein